MDQTARATDPGEVIVMLTLQFNPGAAEHVLERMGPSVRLTRAEPGNAEFRVFRTTGSEDRVVIFERWKDQAALDRHWEQPYTKETLELFAAHLARPLSEAEDVAYLTDVMKPGA